MDWERPLPEGEKEDNLLPASNLEPVTPHDYLFRRVLDELPGGYIVKTQPAELKTMVVFATAEVDGLILSA